MTRANDEHEKDENATSPAVSRRSILAALGGTGLLGGIGLLGRDPDGSSGETPAEPRPDPGIRRSLRTRPWPRPRSVGAGVGALTGTTGRESVVRAVASSTEGRRYYASQEGGVQAAIDRASGGDTVVIDRSFRLPETIQCKSGVAVVGSPAVSGPHLRVGDNAGVDGISPAHTRNVRLHNIAVDGNRTNGGTQGFDAGIGSQTIGSAEDLLISNCTVRNGAQGIVIRSGEQPYRLRNVSIRDCYVDSSRKHGIYAGEYNHDSSGQSDNITIAGNLVANTEQFIGITVQGRARAPVRNAAIRYNHVDGVGRGTDAQGGEGVYTEDHVYDTVMEWNLISNCRSQAGGVTMAGNNVGNAARNNLVRNSDGGLCFSGLWHDGGGPTDCSMEHNTVVNVSDWAIRAQEVGSGNAVRNCTFDEYGTRVLGGSVSLSRNEWNRTRSGNRTTGND